MSDALTLSLELAALTAAAALVVYAVVKLDVRPLLAGGALAISAWMLAGWFSEAPRPYTRPGLRNLRLRPVDAVSGESVRGLTANVLAPDDTGQIAAWRLPAVADENDGAIATITLFVQEEISGSSWAQARRPADCIRIDDQRLEIAAPGYEPWRGGLKQLLSEREPADAGDNPIVIELRREP
jgi:hypothetical protein